MKVPRHLLGDEDQLYHSQLSTFVLLHQEAEQPEHEETTQDLVVLRNAKEEEGAKSPEEEAQGLQQGTQRPKEAGMEAESWVMRPRVWQAVTEQGWSGKGLQVPVAHQRPHCGDLGEEMDGKVASSRQPWRWKVVQLGLKPAWVSGKQEQTRAPDNLDLGLVQAGEEALVGVDRRWNGALEGRYQDSFQVEDENLDPMPVEGGIRGEQTYRLGNEERCVGESEHGNRDPILVSHSIRAGKRGNREQKPAEWQIPEKVDVSRYLLAEQLEH